MIFNKTVEFDTATDAWDEWYKLLVNENDELTSRDGDVVGECINAITIIRDPTRCLLNSQTRKLSTRYAVGEFLWYLSGNNELAEIQKYTQNWNRMSDDGKHVNSNYGYCIKRKFGFDQYEQVKRQLTERRSTRQAIIHIKGPNDNLDSKDVNCTVCLQFFIRNDKLYVTTYMRSCDLWLGFPYDVFAFTNIQILMSMEMGLGLGTYTHICGSLHLYGRNVKQNG